MNKRLYDDFVCDTIISYNTKNVVIKELKYDNNKSNKIKNISDGIYIVIAYKHYHLRYIRNKQMYYIDSKNFPHLNEGRQIRIKYEYSQKDDYSCGTWTILFALYLLKNPNNIEIMNEVNFSSLVDIIHPILYKYNMLYIENKCSLDEKKRFELFNDLHKELKQYKLTLIK